MKIVTSILTRLPGLQYPISTMISSFAHTNLDALPKNMPFLAKDTQVVMLLHTLIEFQIAYVFSTNLRLILYNQLINVSDLNLRGLKVTF